VNPNTVDALVMIAGLLTLLALVKIITDHITTRRLMGAHLSDTALRELLLWTKELSRQSALKWGLVGVVVGAALIVIDLLPVEAGSASGFGIVIIAGGIGLLAYHGIVQRGDRRE
jgi:hypothetical protein